MRLTDPTFNADLSPLLPIGETAPNDSVNSAAITEGVDAAQDTSTIYTMQPGDTFSGTISAGSDWDWVAINLVAGETYQIALDGVTLSDPYLQLYDGSGNYITFDDDSGAGSNALISFTPTTSGTYYISAEAWSFSETGSYQLSVSDAGTPPPPPPPATNSPLDAIDWQSFTAPSTINVYFVPGGLSVNEAGDSYTTTGWDSYEIGQAMTAFSNFSDVANVTFNVVTDPAQADFMMIESTDATSALGYWGVGGGSISVGGVSYNLDGWGVFNAADPSWSTDGLAVGGYGYVTLIHEIGHGMGLAHPHDNGGGSEIMNGVAGPFGSLGDFDLNQGVWTTMSYNDGWQTAPHGLPPGQGYGFQGTLMALDIAVLQQMYGANTGENTGDDSYVLPTANVSGTHYAAIWDAGGTDTIVHNGSAAATIDLRAATLDYAAGGGGFMSYVTGIHGGFTIADGVVIENATGGSGADAITGNDAGNRLFGRGGNDTILGGGGDDTVVGGEGHDRLVGEAGNDVLYGFNQNDTLLGGDGDDRLFPGNGSDWVYGQGGNDMIVDNGQGGAIGADHFFGGDGDDTILGGGGNDTVHGGNGFDKLFGANDNDVIYGGNQGDYVGGGIGNDMLYGGNGRDSVYGGDGDDLLIDNAQSGFIGGDTFFGNLGNDTIQGGGGSDTLNGGFGDDSLSGGANDDLLLGYLGNDIFVFSDGFGNDTILDFEATNNAEKIDLSGLSAVADYSVLTSGGRMSQIGADVVIDDGIGNTLTLQNVLLADLDQHDFIF